MSLISLFWLPGGHRECSPTEDYGRKEGWQRGCHPTGLRQGTEKGWHQETSRGHRGGTWGPALLFLIFWLWGIVEIRKYSSPCLSLQQRHTQSWSEFRKNSLFSFQTDATGDSLNLCLFVVETETREGQQCAHGLETSSLLIHGKDSFGDHFKLLAMWTLKTKKQ